MGRLISLIYFYLVSVIALILLIIGLYNVVSFTVNLTQYDKYPLRYPGEDVCSTITPQAPVPDKTVPSMTPAPTPDLIAQKQQCEQRQDEERKQHKVDDLKNAIYFTLIGIILLALHFPIALRKSNEGK